jgi:hypothetical protein
MYRHLANWPPFLAIIHLLLLPMEKDGRLETNVELAINSAHSSGTGITERLAVPDFSMTDTAQTKSKYALENLLVALLVK